MGAGEWQAFSSLNGFCGFCELLGMASNPFLELIGNECSGRRVFGLDGGGRRAQTGGDVMDIQIAPLCDYAADSNG
jgi:hypothetical protein